VACAFVDNVFCFALKNKFIVSSIIIFGTLSFPLASDSRRLSGGGRPVDVLHRFFLPQGDDNLVTPKHRSLASIISRHAIE